MYPDLPPLNWLRAFEAAARTLSFTSAAAEMHITQAAVSKHIKSLEMRLGHALFVRRPRGLGLTKNGDAYLPKVQDALDRLAIGTREVFGSRTTEALTVRCAVAFSVNWLAQRLPNFLDRHPNINVRVISSVWNDAFDKDAFDIDIQYGSGEWPEYSSYRLTREHLVPLCSPQLSERMPLNVPDDLARHRLLHVLGYQEGWGVWLKAANAKVDPGQGLQLDNSLTAFEVAAHCGGVALGRTSLAEAACANGRLIAPFSLAVPINEGFYVRESLSSPKHRHADHFLNWIRNEATQKS